MEFEKFKKRIGIKIKYYRNLRDITQARLAEMIGCQVNYISIIENGGKNMSLKMIYKISNALEVSAAKIFDIDD